MPATERAVEFELRSPEGSGDDPFTITHVGPRRSEIGGMQTVLRDYHAHVPQGARFRFIASYTARGRTVSALLFAVALLRVALTPRSVLGSVHVHVAQGGSVMRKSMIAGLCRRRRIPVVATVHASELDDDLRRHHRPWSLLLARCDAIAALSREAVEALTQLDPTARVEQVPNRVPVPGEPVSAPNTKRVLFAGAVCRRKGVDVLFAAWSTVLERHPDAELLVGGPPVDVAVPQMPGVRTLGSLAPAEVRTLIRDVDIAVLPSRSEGLPMFVLEAMAAGRPVVTTDIGDLAEIVGDGGSIVEPGCVASLANALSGLLDDPGGAARRGTAGRRRVAQHCDIAQVGVDLRRLHHDPARLVA